MASPNAVRLVRTLPSVGPKFMTYTNVGFTLFDLDGTTHLSVAYPPAPAGYLWPFDGPWYVTEDLFDLDATTVEFVIQVPSSGGGASAFAVLREEGTMLFWGPGKFVLPSTLGPFDILTASPWIFNTPQGAIMSLKDAEGAATIYQLPGSLPCLQCDGTLSPSGLELGEEPAGQAIEQGTFVFPNPASTSSEIVFGTSQGTTVLAVQLIGAGGALVKRFLVPNGADRLSVGVGDVATGVYSYRLETDKGIVPGSRLVVVR